MNTTHEAVEAFEEGSDDSKEKQVAVEVAVQDSDDSKRMRLVGFPGSVIDLGQPTGANRIAVDEFHCTICMEPRKQLDESFDVKHCSHKFCKTCMSRYVTAMVHQNAIWIKCPDLGCKDGSLEPDMCRPILPEHVFDRWGVALCEFALGTNKFHCPYKDCSVLLANDGDGGTMMTIAECPHCRRTVCVQCEVPWHEGINCEGFQQLDEDERGREDLMLRQLAADSKWQRCPHCRMYVEKTDGCMFMNCRCGLRFCYVCGSPISKDCHYCDKCRR